MTWLEIQVDRTQWDAWTRKRRPDSVGRPKQHGALLNRTGTMSILGFYLAALGVEPDHMRDWALPFRVAREYGIANFTKLHDPDWVDCVLTAEGYEDPEPHLITLFSHAGVKLRFVGGV